MSVLVKEAAAATAALTKARKELAAAQYKGQMAEAKVSVLQEAMAEMQVSSCFPTRQELVQCSEVQV